MERELLSEATMVLEGVFESSKCVESVVVATIKTTSGTRVTVEVDYQ